MNNRKLNNEPDYLTLQECAERLGCEVKVIHYLVKPSTGLNIDAREVDSKTKAYNYKQVRDGYMSYKNRRGSSSKSKQYNGSRRAKW